MVSHTRIKVILTLGLAVMLTGIVLNYGDRIPLLNTLPFFEAEHDLVPVTDEQGDILYWTCTMHPSVRMKEPGTCPICAMNLVPVRKQAEEETGDPSSQSQPTRTQPASIQPAVDIAAPDRSTFTVDPVRQQLIGVQTETVGPRNLDRTIRTVGIIETDERRTAQIHTKVGGWVEDVFVDYTWQHVKKGDPLFSIYSPDLVSTQEEYLTALKAVDRLGDTGFPDVGERARRLLTSTRTRLLFFDVTPAQIEALERSREVQKTLVVYSSIEGHVVERNAFPGMRVEPNTRLYTLVDHSYVWVHVEVYEQDIAFVRTGQRATMTVEAYPGKTFSGRVTFIEPHMMRDTRTLRVRLEFPNPGLLLKPEMYAHIELRIPVGERLAVPASAVLRTGRRDVVFVSRGEGRMELRQVELGIKTDAFYEVLQGLQPGERIVTAANFLIDAESKVQGVQPVWEGQGGGHVH